MQLNVLGRRCQEQELGANLHRSISERLLRKGFPGLRSLIEEKIQNIV